MPMNVSSSGSSDEANIFLGLIEYELNSLLGASHLVDCISVYIRFDLERYLLIIYDIWINNFGQFDCSLREISKNESIQTDERILGFQT